MVNVTATTGIYTYGHTLSQHDALPIYLRDHALGGRSQPLGDHARIDLDRVVLDSDPRHRGSIIASPRARLRRSEEPTSELQSLMRISYAVFCLNKKTSE